MIEYTITHTFDQFRSNFSNRKGKKRGKKHFFQQQNAFFQNPWKWFNFYMQYVYGKVLKCRKRHFCPFLKIIKIDLNRSKSMQMTKISKNQIPFLVCKKAIFHYFWKWTKILFSTFQDLSIDILHVKIRPFLQILKKMAKKVRFCSFLTLAVGKN